LNAIKEEMGDSFFGANEEDFLYAIRTTITDLRPKYVPTPTEVKQDLISEILSLLAAHSRRNEHMMKTEESKMKFMSVDALQARLAELKYKIDVVSTPVSTLKAFVAESRVDNRRYPGFPDLDKSVTAARIKALPTSELKKLIRVHSVEQVNDRLSGRN
jgi:hypothetical protein